MHGLERGGAGVHEEGGHAEAIDVGLDAGHGVRRDALGRDVHGGRQVRRAGVEELSGGEGHVEVAEAGPVVLVEQHVVGLDVAVQQLVRVRVRQGGPERAHDREDAVGRELAPAHRLRERPARHQLHREEVPALVLLRRPQHRHDVRVVELLHAQRGPLEPTHLLRAPGVLRVEDLQRDDAVERAVVDPPHRRGRALADRREQEVAAVREDVPRVHLPVAPQLLPQPGDLAVDGRGRLGRGPQPLAALIRLLQRLAPPPHPHVTPLGLGRARRGRLVLGHEQRQRPEPAVQRGHQRIAAAGQARARLDQRLVDVAVRPQPHIEGPRERVGGGDRHPAAHRQHGQHAEVADQPARQAAEAVLAGLDLALAGGEEHEVREPLREQPEPADEVVLLDDVDRAGGGLEEQHGLAGLGAGAAVGDDVQERIGAAGQGGAQLVEGGGPDRAPDRAQDVARDVAEAGAHRGGHRLGVEGGEVVIAEVLRAGDEDQRPQVAAPQLAKVVVDRAGNVAGVGDALVEGDEAEAGAGRAAQPLPQQQA